MTWSPTEEDLADAQVLALARALGVPDYDALLALSTEDPAAYWAGVRAFLGIVWSRPPQAYVDASRGLEFPRWFPGGELNWVDSVLRFADDPASAARAAVVAEREDGSVRQLTYAELAERVRRVAGGLAALGVERGDRVGLLRENGVEATVTLLALAHLGAIVVPLFSGFGADAIAARLGACEARGLVATTGLGRRGRWIATSATVREVLRRTPSIDLVVRKGEATGPDVDWGVPWESLLDGPPTAAARMSPDDPFMVIYTSGTTGRPKGAVHTHGGFPLKIAHDAAVHFDIGAGDTLCWPADMGWIAGALVLCSALLRGATLVCYDGAPDHPDWSRMSRLAERHRVTHLGAAPTLIRGLAAHPDVATRGDVSSVRRLITAGEAIDPEHFAWFQQHFGGGRRPVINYTGGTEVSGALLSSVVVRPIAPAAFNTVSPGVDADVIGPDGAAVVGEPGELAIRAPFVGMTRSFWRDDQRYLDTFWRTVPGWWVHGDLALHRASGDYLMLGRSDDTLKVAGKRLGPAEVEEVVAGVAGVAESAAVGVPDSVKGERLIVFVVPTGEIAVAELSAGVRVRVEAALGKAFRPSAVHVVAELPKTRSAKIMRRVIRGAYTRQRLGDLSSLDNPSAVEAISELCADE